EPAARGIVVPLESVEQRTVGGRRVELFEKVADGSSAGLDRSGQRLEVEPVTAGVAVGAAHARRDAAHCGVELGALGGKGPIAASLFEELADGDDLLLDARESVAHCSVAPADRAPFGGVTTSAYSSSSRRSLPSARPYG